MLPAPKNLKVGGKKMLQKQNNTDTATFTWEYDAANQAKINKFTLYYNSPGSTLPMVMSGMIDPSKRSLSIGIAFNAVGVFRFWLTATSKTGTETPQSNIVEINVYAGSAPAEVLPAPYNLQVA